MNQYVLVLEVPEDLTLGDGTIEGAAHFINDAMEDAGVKNEISVRPLSEILAC